MASRGAAVALIARRAPKLREVAARCGARALPIVADMTHRSDVRRAVREAIEHFGRIDVWVNNVGRGITRNPSELTDEDVNEMMRINVFTALYGMQEVLPHFKERGAGQIVNVSSMLGRIPFAVYRAAYSACKHYLNALTANLRDELSGTHPGIVVTLVSPGTVRTEFGKNALHGGPESHTLPYSQSAEEVAAVIADAIESGKQDVYTRKGFAERVAKYFADIGEDPP